MKGRFKTPLWVIPVLAMVMALGAFAVFAGINQFSASPAEADIQEAGKGLSSRVDLEKLTEPLETPLQDATLVITGSGATVNPNDPGRATRLEVVFQVAAVLDSGTSQIIVTLDDDFIVPTTLDRNQITIRSSDVSNTSGPDPGVTASDAVPPQSVTIDFVGTENDEPEITMTVPDMLEGNNDPAIGGQGIEDNSTVTVVFQQSAGIRNSSESSSTTRGSDGTRSVSVRTSAEPTDVTATVFIPVRVELSTDGDPRGANMTVVALGVEGGKTATFWLDKDGDGTRDVAERDVCSVVAASDDTATCTFTLQNPPFHPSRLGTVVNSGETLQGGGVNATNTTLTLSDFDATTFNVGQTIRIDSENMLIEALDASAGNETLTVVRGTFGSTAAAHSAGATVNTVPVNFINVRDGDGRVTTGGDDSALTQAVINRQTFELEPTVTVSPTTANVGDTITVSLFDFNPGSVDRILINGLRVTEVGASIATIPGSGQVSFGFTLPGQDIDNSRIPTGASRFDVFGGTPEVDNDTTLTIGGARLTLSHQTVVANQDLTISVSGFTQGGGVCIDEQNILLNNVSLNLDPDDVDCTITGVTGVQLSSGGTATFTVQVHQANIGSGTSIDTALLTEGTHEMRLIDTRGAEGTIQVTIAERTLEVTPISARPRDVVTIIGRAFVGDNPDGVSSSVTVEYQCGADARSVTADPDVSGNFRETLRIPSNCAIPSDNTITADISTNGQDTGVVETVIHAIPDALVRVEPVRGQSGTLVRVSGEGFRTFETVSSVEFGNLGVLGGRTANTDGSGNFTIDDIVVPGLDPGVRAVEVTVGSGGNETTASTSFEILEAGFAGALTTDVEDALSPVMDTLDRAFLFDNTSKEWQFFDTRTEFEDINTLLEVPSGAPIWLRVTEDTQVELGGQPFNLTCVNPGTPEEDCWNLIVFP